MNDSTTPTGFRRTVLRWVLIACASTWLGIAVLATSTKTAVMPGPLSKAHAILADDCGACHSTEWEHARSLLHGITADAGALAESRRCVHCHRIGERALLAHGGRGGEPTERGEELACSGCHREHQGSGHDLAAVADAACATCHASRAGSFPHDHPEFDHWPYRRPTRIAFDHRSHRTEHFAAEGQPFDCTACHRVDPRDGFMVTATFEDSCTSCHHHTEQIRGAGHVEPGIAIARLPGVDVEALAASGIRIEGWPATVDGDCEEPPVPAMDLLIAGDATYPEFAGDRAVLTRIDLADLTEASEPELLVVARYLRAIRRLWMELQRDPRATAASRLHRALGQHVAEPTIDTVARGLSSAAIAACARAWFGDATDADERWHGDGDWYRDDDTFTLYYEPAHHRDRFLTALHDLAAGAARAVGPALLRELRDDDGRCTRCHTVARDATARPAVQWHARRPVDDRPFTRFTHTPHILSAGEQGCAGCHRLDSAARAGADNDDRTGDFVAMDKRTCASCHRAEGAGHTCATCHHYHVGSLPVRLPEPR